MQSYPVAHVAPYPHPLISFQPPRPHRDLHSFPTRRSSDLKYSVLSAFRRKSETCRGLMTVATFWRILLLRSEEHTSELQSLTNIVCRLLLEKKKRSCLGITETIKEGCVRTSRRDQG